MSSNNTINVWEERYRPRTIKDLILPDRLKLPFLKMVEAKEIQNLILEGPPGCGKTTAALALCNELGCDWIKINGSLDSGIDVIRGRVTNFASTGSIGSLAKHKVVIFDEGDYLNANSTQPALRSFINDFAETCRFIFTVNYKNKLIEPLHSRCPPISFNFSSDEKIKMAGEFFARCETILKENSIGYDKPSLAAVIKRSFPDFRKTLGELQRYSMSGPIDSGILEGNSSSKISSLVDHMKAKDFSSIRKFFSANQDLSPQEFFSVVYKILVSELDPQSVPQAVLILADYQNKAAFAANQEINYTACCVQLMLDCKYLS